MLWPGPWLNIKVQLCNVALQRGDCAVLASRGTTHPNMPRAVAYIPAFRTTAWQYPASPL